MKLLTTGPLLNVSVVQASDFFADEGTVAAICAAVGPRLLLRAQREDPNVDGRSPHKRQRTESTTAATTSTPKNELHEVGSSQLKPLEVRPRSVLPEWCCPLPRSSVDPGHTPIMMIAIII